jgi:hypothetical protein
MLVATLDLKSNTVPQIKVPHFNVTRHINFYMQQSIPNKVQYSELLGFLALSII